ncbi:MAG: ABC transporter permease subunit [Dysgonamonadaceae bacterium]|jgi:ABC-type amino acid transport system permease subunit|nr:ABC transporter permease subunit [Dysgonamonadaceae bacterium]
MNVFEILSKYKDEFLIGAGVTIKIAILVWIIGLIVGGLLGILGAKYKRFIGIPSRTISFILGGIPALVFLFWLHYPAQRIFNVVIDGFYSTVFALSVINTFLIADLVRNALSTFPEQYIVSAEVMGFSSREITWKIQIPLILRQIIPSVLITEIVMLHSTLFGSFIAVDEIFRIALRVNSEVYRPVEVFSILAIFFLIISLPIAGFASWLKKRYSRNLSKI